MGKVVFVTARCSNQAGQSFGKNFRLRFEEDAADCWILTDASKIDMAATAEVSTSQGSSDMSTMNGTFEFYDHGYSGCPYCHTMEFFFVHGNVCCWDGQQETVICPWDNLSHILGSGKLEMLHGREQEKTTGLIERTEEKGVMLLDQHNEERGLM